MDVFPSPLRHNEPTERGPRQGDAGSTGIRHSHTAKNIVSRPESPGRAGAKRSSRKLEGFNDTMNHPQRRAVTPMLHTHPEIKEEIKNVLMFFNTGEAWDGKPDVLSRWSEGFVTESNTIDSLHLNLMWCPGLCVTWKRTRDTSETPGACR